MNMLSVESMAMMSKISSLKNKCKKCTNGSKYEYYKSTDLTSNGIQRHLVKSWNISDQEVTTPSFHRSL